ncbi:S-layer homology domain-containing protein [Caryophanon tenue]|uniref:SLH domain-containing protein n=1 Tax=Caryophanon tenue TaxID=33978 RepID=A0A1C0YBQ6_9BACL|nr:S-layer homology domain-containing protein [Caryophanon tenue]OCS84580.1 hypothetical protein A6M13_03100 [Caryophanon tenue]
MKNIVVGFLTIIIILSIPIQSLANFKDVPSSHSLAIEINNLVDKGIINGYPDNTFRGNELISKKHIAKMLVHALDLPMTNLKNPNYKDVPVTHPYYIEIAAAYTAGIFSDATYFKPDSNISRAFMAKILAKSFSLNSISENGITYVDVAKNSSFHRDIQLVTMNNIAKGFVENGKHVFKPNQLLTRAHFSAFLARALSLKNGKYYPESNQAYYYHNNDTATYGEYIRSWYDEKNVTSKSKEIEAISYYILDEEGNGHYVSIDTYTISQSKWAFQNFYSRQMSLPIILEVPYPFTIGKKVGYRNQRLEILNTDLNVKVAGKTYENVIEIVATTTNFDAQSDGYNQPYTEKIYIAENYGIIGSKNMNGYWSQWLDHIAEK